MADNVIVGDFNRPSISIRRPDTLRCLHSYVEVDPKNRVVVCTSCEQVVDPIDILLQIARRERDCWYQTKQARECLAELETQIAAAKAVKRSLDQKISRRRKQTQNESVP